MSIGVQSLEPRRARHARSRSSVRRRARGASSARSRAAASTTSADFILGTPGGDGATSDASLVATGVDHLSVYELTIEERTAFGQRVRDGRLVPLDEDALAELYIATHDALTARGLRALRESARTRARASAR